MPHPTFTGIDVATGTSEVDGGKNTQFKLNVYATEATDSTLGIVGMGGIGLEIAQRATALKMKICYHNRNPR